MSRNHGAGRVVALALLLAAAVALPAAAQVAEVVTSSHNVTFVPQVDYARLVLTVSGGDKYVRLEFGPGETPAVSIYDAAGEELPDGTYAWELRAAPRVESLRPADYANERMAEDGSVYQEGRVPAGAVQSGYFTILDGAVVSPDRVEPGPPRSERVAGNPFQEASVLTNADGVIRNSLCVGFDCPNNPNFGFTTILMLENNTRILFDDTSTLSGFPNADWQLTANDSASGGANKFSIEETSAGRVPFTIRGGAPSNSLFVDSGGRIGRRTATPVLEFHIVDGDTPSIRLEQDNSSGFGPQTWDIAGNETNFFVRDATGGSALPFRIRPGAPGNSIFTDVDGDLGLGTSSPGTVTGIGGAAASDASVHVVRSDGAASILVEENSTSAAARVMLELRNNAGGVFINMIDETGADADQWQLKNAGGWFAIARNGTEHFRVVNNGDIQAPAGTVVHSSSRTIKRNIRPVDGGEVLARVASLPVATWEYDRSGPQATHLGPMAEDFYAAFGLGTDERTMASSDACGVAIAAIQALNHKVEALAAQNTLLQSQLDGLTGSPGD